MTMRQASPLFVLLVLVNAACERGTSTPPPPAAAEAQAADKEDDEVASRVEVEVTADGYRPLEVKAKAGQELTMVFTRTSDADCGQRVIVPDFGIERDLPVGTPVEVTFTPEHTGRIGFMCGMGMMKGAILVQ